MTAAPRHPDLHELVDQLNPAQTDALRAVVLQLVTPPAETTETIETLPRRFSFGRHAVRETDFAAHSDEILDEIVRHSAG